MRVTKSQLHDNGFPVYQNCLTPMGYYNNHNCPANTTFVICGGAAGNIGYTYEECWAADDCEYIIPSDKVNSRYLYHVLYSKKDYLLSQVRKASIPRLSPTVIKEMEIPVPSIEDQNRVVSILDQFEALTSDISSGLPAEIAMRTQQYEYYRNKLLTFKRA